MGGGRFARILVGLCQGQSFGKGAKPSAEVIRDSMGQIMAEDGYIVPKSIGDEMSVIMKTLSGA